MGYGKNCLTTFGQNCEPNYRAYEKKGILYIRNSSANTGALGVETQVSEADLINATGGADQGIPGVLIVDGVYRVTTTVNGMVPGPAIEVDEGDTVVVHM